MKNENDTCQPTEIITGSEITFHSVNSDTNLVKGEYIKDGQTHTVYILAVPENNLKNYSYEAD
jgi:hypothetical protein